jgi:RHS repeat-associated protein
VLSERHLPSTLLYWHSPDPEWHRISPLTATSRALGRISEVGPGTTTRYYLTDALGSVLALVDSSGSVLNTYEYDVFGAVRSSTGSTANAFTFTGEQTDASTGLEYLRARYYDADTGRFLSLDPLGDGYDYAYDNPVMFTDPSGLSPVTGEACADIKDRISNLNGGAPKIEERIRRIWQSVYDTHCGSLIAPSDSSESGGAIGDATTGGSVQSGGAPRLRASSGAGMGTASGGQTSVPDPVGRSCNAEMYFTPLVFNILEDRGVIIGATVKCRPHRPYILVMVILETRNIFTGEWETVDVAIANCRFAASCSAGKTVTGLAPGEYRLFGYFYVPGGVPPYAGGPSRPFRLP